MKKIFLILIGLMTLTSMTYAQDAAIQDNSNQNNSIFSDERSLQLGADFLVPYRIDSPSGRTATLFGAHAELFFVPAWSVSLQGIFGVEDKGFVDNPVYIAPGMSFYTSPGKFIEPYIHADLPILLNNSQDLGVRGGLGFMINTGLAGLALRYSFDATYFFDAEVTSLNLANISAVVNW